MMFLRLVAGFAPWIAFLLIAQGSLLRVKIGLAAALAFSIIMGVLGLHRGIILWAGLAFFAVAAVAIIGFDSLWMLRHLGVLANGTLALAAWATIAAGRPFTLDYARQHTDPALWRAPAFIRANVVIASVWAAVFAVNTLLAFVRMLAGGSGAHGWIFDVASHGLLVATAAFTAWYPGFLRRRVARMKTAGTPGA